MHELCCYRCAPYSPAHRRPLSAERNSPRMAAVRVDCRALRPRAPLLPSLLPAHHGRPRLAAGVPPRARRRLLRPVARAARDSPQAVWHGLWRRCHLVFGLPGIVAAPVVAGCRPGAAAGDFSGADPGVQLGHPTANQVCACAVDQPCPCPAAQCVPCRIAHRPALATPALLRPTAAAWRRPPMQSRCSPTRITTS